MHSSFPLRPAAVALSVLSALATAPALVAQLTIDTVPVGFAGNAADSTGHGAVAYDYRIGTTEVTNAQYAAFLNAVAATDTYALYNTNMDSSSLGGITRSGDSGSYNYTAKTGYENTPVVYVSFWDAARFTNWLNNGQGASSTETGAYTLEGGTASPNNPLLTRNGGAQVWIASENEWYKAAYYDPTLNSGAGGYWSHPTQNNTLGRNNPFTDPDGANHLDADFNYAVYNGWNNGATPVGTYVNADSFFGTFDQGGNVWEWNDTLLQDEFRVLRGGAWDFGEDGLLASSRYGEFPANEVDVIGFRVASFAVVPEPSTYAAFAGALALGFALWRRRRA